MKKEHKEACEKVLADLKAMHEANQSGSSVMCFGARTAEEYCTDAENILKELRRLDRIAEAEKDYIAEFGNDAWGEH